MLDRRAVVGSLIVSVLAAACGAQTPVSQEPSPTVAAQSASPTATPLAPVRIARSAAHLGDGVAANGDFRGAGKSQIALIQDPNRDQSLRITVRESSGDGETFSDSVWLALGPRSFALTRAKFAVADVNADGKDDLVALYDAGENRSRMLVFRSSGTTFGPPETWWEGDDYTWSRARNLLAGKFSANDRDSLLVTYQYDNSDMRIHAFDSTGTAFIFGGSQGVFDSGAGQFDLALAKFAVGRFTRNSGPQQIALLYQYPNARLRVHLLDPGPTGLAITKNVYETNEGDYDLSRGSFAAADVTGDGRDDLIAIYSDDDGSARVQVFDAASSFKPANGFTGWASLSSGSSCAGATALVLGDWNGDRKIDAAALVPGDGVAFRSSVLRNIGGAFAVTSTTEPTVCPRWPLTGLPLNGASATKRPLYVKVDNNQHARPHYGIAQADQVYEWLVEGLTTRLAAVFQSRDPNVIGSVRSARITDTPIVPSLDAAFVYSGGGPEELMRLHYEAAVARRYVDLSPGYGWGYRVGFRDAPYNYFTSYAALRDALAGAPSGDQPVSIPSWDFLPNANGDAQAGGFGDSGSASAITIPYRAGFTVRYQYDPGSRSYARFQDGVREADGATGEVIAAKNVVVIGTEVHFTTDYGLDPAGSPKLFMQLVGSGQASVFRDGRREDVTWIRPDVFDVFQFRNAAGEAVRLEPGQTWIHIVPSDWSIPSQ
ncbi:MAG: DUF3048 domain-containing protein [Chloroflexi bacterium]|nr:MAG: DUF3048 domain-containing protein [Chloroflexota bacterium]